LKRYTDSPRVDSLRNIVRDPRVALPFLIPGSGSTMRVNGRAQISVHPGLLASFNADGKAPRTVIIMTVDEIYFRCARAIVRSDLWNPDKRVDPKTLPTPGQILADMSDNRVGGGITTRYGRNARGNRYGNGPFGE
jgi:uncharacterized protein